MSLDKEERSGHDGSSDPDISKENQEEQST